MTLMYLLIFYSVDSKGVMGMYCGIAEILSGQVIAIPLFPTNPADIEFPGPGRLWNWCRHPAGAKVLRRRHSRQWRQPARCTAQSRGSFPARSE